MMWYCVCSSSNIIKFPRFLVILILLSFYFHIRSYLALNIVRFTCTADGFRLLVLYLLDRFWFWFCDFAFIFCRSTNLYRFFFARIFTFSAHFQSINSHQLLLIILYLVLSLPWSFLLSVSRLKILIKCNLIQWINLSSQSLFPELKPRKTSAQDLRMNSQYFNNFWFNIVLICIVV